MRLQGAVAGGCVTSTSAGRALLARKRCSDYRLAVRAGASVITSETVEMDDTQACRKCRQEPHLMSAYMEESGSLRSLRAGWINRHWAESTVAAVAWSCT